MSHNSQTLDVPYSFGLYWYRGCDSNPLSRGDVAGISLFLFNQLYLTSALLGYPDSLRVVLHFVHLKNVIVEWIVSSAASTFQVSLSVFPHVSHTKRIVGSCLSCASLLWSMTAISATFPSCRLIFLFDSLSSIGFWYLHFGHLSVKETFFAVWSIDPHFGQKSIIFTCVKILAGKFHFLLCIFLGAYAYHLSKLLCFPICFAPRVHIPLTIRRL